MTECRKTETKAASHEKELLQGADEKFKWKQENCAYLTRRKQERPSRNSTCYIFYGG